MGLLDILKNKPSGNIVKDAAEGIVEGVGSVLDKLSTSDQEKLEAKNKLAEIILPHLSAAINAQASVLQTEMAGSKLQRNWRPIVMLSFAFIILYRYFIAPVFHAPPVELPDRFFDLLELGLGGYVIGRSVEKVAETVTKNVDISFLKKKDRNPER